MKTITYDDTKWKLVPVEPTEEMLHALVDAGGENASWVHGYMAMLTAATQAPDAEKAALQAQIDALMLEFCPERMTPEQTAEWARHQKAVPDAKDSYPFPTTPLEAANKVLDEYFERNATPPAPAQAAGEEYPKLPEPTGLTITKPVKGVCECVWYGSSDGNKQKLFSEAQMYAFAAACRAAALATPSAPDAGKDWQEPFATIEVSGGGLYMSVSETSEAFKSGKVSDGSYVVYATPPTDAQSVRDAALEELAHAKAMASSGHSHDAILGHIDRAIRSLKTTTAPAGDDARDVSLTDEGKSVRDAVLVQVRDELLSLADQYLAAGYEDEYAAVVKALERIRAIKTTTAPAGEAPNVEQAIQQLVSALQASKGWLHDYADSIIRDAIDRKAPAGEDAEKPSPYLQLLYDMHESPDVAERVILAAADARDAARYRAHRDSGKFTASSLSKGWALASRIGLSTPEELDCASDELIAAMKEKP